MENVWHGRSSRFTGLIEDSRQRVAGVTDNEREAIHEIVRGLTPREASKALMFKIGCWNARLRIMDKSKLVRIHCSDSVRGAAESDIKAYDHCRRLIVLGMRRLGRIHRTTDIPIAETGFWACIDECWRPEFFGSYELRRKVQTEYCSFSTFADHIHKLNHISCREYTLTPGRRGFATDDYGIDILARSWYLFKNRKCIAFYERLAREHLIDVYKTLFGEIRDLKDAEKWVQSFDSYSERYQEHG